MVFKVVLTFVPRRVTAPMATTATSARIRPYSESACPFLLFQYRDQMIEHFFGLLWQMQFTCGNATHT